MGATLKIRISSLSSGIQPYFGWRYTNALGNVILVRFYFVNEPGTQQYEAIIGPNLNQSLKDAVDTHLVPGGDYLTSIDDYYLYIEFTGVGHSFFYSVSNHFVYTGEVSGVTPPAIVITQSLPANALLNAYNNNVIRFTAEGYEYIEAVGNEQLPLRLYPSPTGEYYFNFQDYATTLINQNKFEDEILPEIETDGYVYPDPSLFLELLIKLTSGPLIQTSKFYFLKSVAQIQNYSDKFINNNYILLPKNGLQYNVTYYEGYPFDVSIFCSALVNFILRNKTNGHTVVLEAQKNVNRLFFSQGSENFTIDDILPMKSGINRLELDFNENGKLDLIVNKKESKSAPYFKFYRNGGGFGYIRFESEVEVKNRTKEGESIPMDFNGIQNTLRRSIGAKETSVEMELETEFLDQWEMENFKDFISSPRVEMYVSDLFQKQTAKSWIGITVKTNSLDVKKLKTERSKVRVIIDFALYNLHL